jgi:hypothetical protein
MTLRYETRSRVSTYTQSWVGGEPDFGVFESIATTTLGSSTSTVTFSSIPTGYKHLQIRMINRGTGTSAFTILVRVNGDTGSNYAHHFLEGDGASAVAGGSASQTYITFYAQPKSNATANVFGAYIIDVLDYANTNKNKTFRHLGGFDANGSGYVDLDSGLWMSNSAITSIEFTTGATSFAQYSHFALYGIKG